MVEVGKRYYFVCHAYYHYVGTIVSVEGAGRYILRDCVRVHSSNRDFTEFLRDGFGPSRGKSDTTYTRWPDGTAVSGVIVSAPFPHPIPEDKG